VKHLFNNLDQQNIQFVGFDMDGTLYDECDFIVQPYRQIANEFIKSDEAFEFMVARWLAKGSSYNRIFDETYDKYLIDGVITKNEFIDQSLATFRNFEPQLQLAKRTQIILNNLQASYTLFLVTDGNPKLQKEKFSALGLSQYFDPSNVVFTGEYNQTHHKPSTKSLQYLNITPQHSVFFGDRELDYKFALDAKMQFIKVYNMVVINEGK